MNKWIKKSIDLANSQGYLDKLFEVYPVEVGSMRYVAKDMGAMVRKAFQTRNKLNLVKELLKLPRFPIDDPYLASLRKHSYLLEQNPKTVERIGKRLFAMDLDNLLSLVAKPKSPSRQFGNSFQKWLKKKNYLFLDRQEFKNYKGTAFLEGSDSKLKEFFRQDIKLKGLTRRPDFVLTKKNKIIIGEAKFLTDNGGTQNNQFDGALKMAKIKTGKIIGIAVVDGILWFKSNAYMHRTVKSFKGIALSALLLEEFIKGN